MSLFYHTHSFVLTKQSHPVKLSSVRFDLKLLEMEQFISKTDILHRETARF